MAAADEFDDLAGQFRSELPAHCYRMLRCQPQSATEMRQFPDGRFD
jgi:hypothetical protein